MAELLAPGFVGMPPGGIYRAGRWEDVELFPPPAPGFGTEPLNGGPRWEDIAGGFATAKCSASSEAAIGRHIARFKSVAEFKPSETGHDGGSGGVVNRILNFMTGNPDPGEPELPVEGNLPRGYLNDIYESRIPGDRPVVFIDLEDAATIDFLQAHVRNPLEALGLGPIDQDLARQRDRRVTRICMHVLHAASRDGRYGLVAGIRYPGHPDPEWEAFVVWAPPEHLSLTGPDVVVRWVAPWDDDLVAAAQKLAIRIPDTEKP